MEETSGHQVPTVACAGDLAPASEGAVQVLSCEGLLLQGKPRGNRFTTVAKRDLRIFPYPKGDWRMEWLAADGDTAAVAITNLSNDSSGADQVPLVSRVAWTVPGSDRPRIGFERDSLAVTSLAVRNKVAMATVTSASGVHDLITVPLGPP